MQSRGSVGLYRLPVAGGPAERIGPAADVRGNLSAFAIAKDGAIVAAMATPGGTAELFVRRAAADQFAALTALNRDLLGKKRVAEVDAFTFRTFDGKEIEAFLTKPASLDPRQRPGIR